MRRGLLVEIAVGVARRDLPLFSCSCTEHTLRVSAEVYAAQKSSVHPPPFPPFSSSSSVAAGQSLLRPAAAVAVAGVGLGPSGAPIARMRAVACCSADSPGLAA